MLKKGIYNLILFQLHFLILITCFFNLSKPCAYLIKLSLFQPKSFRRKSNSKKIAIVLDRVTGGGRRDIEIVHKFSKNLPKILFLRRSIIKIIFYYFANKLILISKLIDISGLNNKTKYFDLSFNRRKKLDKFWMGVIFNLKKSFKDNEIMILGFAYYYNTEFPLFVACKNNQVKVKLWNKECFMSDPSVKHRTKINEYRKIFQFFDKISVYNYFMKKMLINMDKKNKNKIYVNGCPRLLDFINKPKKEKKIKNILFLTFNSTTGIPPIKKNLLLNWNASHNKVIKILNEISENKKFNIVVKRKNQNSYNTKIQINKNIRVFEGGTAEKYINKADIIIGHNSGSTIEAIANGKYVMIPFFEKITKQKKFLYKFSQDIVYSSEHNFKKRIIQLAEKKNIYPLKNRNNKKIVKYYLGSSKDIINKCERFLNS